MVPAVSSSASDDSVAHVPNPAIAVVQVPFGHWDDSCFGCMPVQRYVSFPSARALVSRGPVEDSREDVFVFELHAMQVHLPSIPFRFPQGRGTLLVLMW